jgi:hypothetical protein
MGKHGTSKRLTIFLFSDLWQQVGRAPAVAPTVGVFIPGRKSIIIGGKKCMKYEL